MRTDAVVRFVLHGGSEVRVEVESDDWLRVALPDGQQGWLERRYLEIVQL
jgi:SH3-like domain-containing protein